MKKMLWSLLLAGCMFLCNQGTVFANESVGMQNTVSKEEVQKSILYDLSSKNVMNTGEEIHVSVVDYGADGTDLNDDSVAFLEAFQLARYNDINVVITIPKGTYYLDRGIPVFSNTIVNATDATIICRAEQSAMLYVAHNKEDGTRCLGSDCKHGGYSQIKNVTINGGIWNRNSSPEGNTSVFLLWHGENITLENLTCEGATNHFVNVGGSKNVTVSNCIFKDPVDYNGYDQGFWCGYLQHPIY